MSSIEDILNKIKLTNMNSNHKIDINNVYGSVIQSAMELQKEIDRYKDKGIGYEDKKLLTIKNPYKLNTNNNHIKGEWVIEYMGRDLSLEEDNYRWDIHNHNVGIRGYYIVEREFKLDDWLYVRWGNLPTNVKERRETIHKSRLKDMDVIQRDMVNAVRGTINRINR